MYDYAEKTIEKAYKYSKKYRFKTTSGTRGWNDETDAFRHAYMQADLTVKANAGLSQIAGDLHELEGDLINKQSSKEKNMDKWNNQVGRDIGKEINKEYNLAKRIELIKSGQMDDVIANKVAQKLNNGELITNPNDTRKYKTPSEKFSDEIREKWRNMQYSRNSRIQNRTSNNKKSSASGTTDGKWVTINGNHVLIDK